MMKKFIAALSILVFASTLTVSVYAANLPKWFPFSKTNSLREWKERVFRGKVLYAVYVGDISGQETLTDAGYLTAKSDKACSGLIYDIKFSPISKPMISWRWRVDRFPKKRIVEGASPNWVENDDYAARLYVIFPKFPFTRTQCLEYIWDETLPVGLIKDSPYFKNIKLFVLESGNKNIGKWVEEERNISEDYHKAFGKRCENSVGAIAIMTDSDNTASSAEACYDNLKVGYKK